MKGLTAEAVQHVVERPKHLDVYGQGRGAKHMKYAKMANTLKMIERSKALCFDSEELKREFGKCATKAIYINLKKLGIAKPRIVEDDNKVYIWSNDEK